MKGRPWEKAGLAQFGGDGMVQSEILTWNEKRGQITNEERVLFEYETSHDQDKKGLNYG